jgi:hypothetical protein
MKAAAENPHPSVLSRSDDCVRRLVNFPEVLIQEIHRPIVE